MWNEYEIITPFSLSNSYSFSLFSGYCWKHLVCVSVHSLQGGLLINHHADQSLNSFCQWQSALVGKNGKRHDHAILLTGFDICSWKNEPCDTLGMHQNTGWQTWGCPQHELSWFQIKVHFCTCCLSSWRGRDSINFGLSPLQGIFLILRIFLRQSFYFLFVTACLFWMGFLPNLRAVKAWGVGWEENNLQIKCIWRG